MNISVGMTIPGIRSPLLDAHLPDLLSKSGRCQGQVIAGFIIDFYCHKAALVIEVDGDIHDLQQEEDAKREKALGEMGLRIIRFRNNEVLKNLSEVVEQIKNLVLM